MAGGCAPRSCPAAAPLAPPVSGSRTSHSLVRLLRPWLSAVIKQSAHSSRPLRAIALCRDGGLVMHFFRGCHTSLWDCRRGLAEISPDIYGAVPNPHHQPLQSAQPHPRTTEGSPDALVSHSHRTHHASCISTELGFTSQSAVGTCFRWPWSPQDVSHSVTSLSCSTLPAILLPAILLELSCVC